LRFRRRLSAPAANRPVKIAFQRLLFVDFCNQSDP
jgi:hypothetical protein